MRDLHAPGHRRPIDSTVVARRLLACALSSALLGCGVPAPDRVAVMTYNVCNLFDGIDDGTEHPRFDPERGTWTEARYRRKLESLAEVMRRASPGVPDVLALQEVESERVLADLARLLPGRWFLAFAGAGPTGCGIISRWPILSVGRLEPGLWDGLPLRPVLEARVDVRGAELDILVVHWKSRIGGVAATNGARRAAARVVLRRLSSVLADRPGADILVLGDFNQEVRPGAASLPAALVEAGSPPDASSLHLSTDATATGLLADRLVLFDAWSAWPTGGSYAYRGTWQRPDRILLTAGLFDGRDFAYDSFRVFAPSFMADPVTGFPRRDRELDWRYSDHLPLVVELKIRRPAAAEHGGVTP